MSEKEHKGERELSLEIKAMRFFSSEKSFRRTARRTPARVSSCFELSFFTRSGGSCFINGKKYAIKKGGIRFVSPGSLVFSILDYECYSVFFDCSLGDGSEKAFFSSIPNYFDTKNPQLFPPIFEELINLSFSENAPDFLTRKSLMLRLLAEVYNDALIPQNAASGTAEEAVEKAVSYMKLHFGDPITLETLGNNFGYSPLYFLRIFKKQTGTTPHEYLKEIRISKAKQLLFYSDMRISEISETCGFSSVSHFTSLFKTITGKSPGDYRRTDTMLL